MADRISVADALRDSAHAYHALIRGWREDKQQAILRFGKMVNRDPQYQAALDQQSTPESSQLNDLAKAKDLSITICTGNHPTSVCEVQDLLFAFIRRIPREHNLRSLKVSIVVKLPNDATSGNFVVSDVWPCPRLGSDTIHEYKRIKPGQLSRAHMIAFLTDPLRRIRNVGAGRKTQVCSMDFLGSTGKLMGYVERQINDSVRGKADVMNYEVFCGFYQSMREWIRLLEEIVGRGISDKASCVTIGESNVIDLTGDGDDEVDSPQFRARQILDNLAQARIRGSLHALGKVRNELLEFSDEIVELLRESHFEVSSDEQVDFITEIGFRRDTAASLFPEKQNFSFLGYNQLDRLLGGGMVEGKIDTKMHGKRKRTDEERDESGDEDRTNDGPSNAPEVRHGKRQWHNGVH